MFQTTNQLNKIQMHEVSLETGFTGLAMIFNILPQRKLWVMGNQLLRRGLLRPSN